MESDKKSNGAMVGLIVIIIILIVGGIYIWQSNKGSEGEMMGGRSAEGAVTNQDAASLNALEQDSQNTDTNTGVDANAVY